MDYILDGVKYIAKYSQWWMLAIVIIFFIKLLKEKEEEEYLIFKMIGFFILGGFNFTLNDIASIPIVLPIGIGIYYLYMKDKDRKNKYIKEKVAGLGLIMLGVSFINGFIYQGLEYRDIRIDNYSGKVSNLEEEWEGIKEKLKLDDESMLTSFNMSYDKNKKIESIYFDFVNPNKDKIYTVSNNSQGKYLVQAVKNENNDGIFSFSNYGENIYKIEVKEFMKLISNINFAKSSMEEGKKIKNYYITYNASDSVTATTDRYEDTKHYIIDSVDNINFRLAKSRELPLKGVKINYSPMEIISEGGTSSVSTDNYLINPFIGKTLISEDTELLIVENKKENKNLVLHNEDDYKYELLSNLDFNSWEEVDKSEVKNNKPYIILKDDLGATVTIYENAYAEYEKKDDKAFYSIPEHIMEYINTEIKYINTKAEYK